MVREVLKLDLTWLTQRRRMSPDFIGSGNSSRYTGRRNNELIIAVAMVEHPNHLRKIAHSMMEISSIVRVLEFVNSIQEHCRGEDLGT